MSADNYYVVRTHPLGGYTYVMGFASDDSPDRTAKPKDKSWSTVHEAVDAAVDEYSEYGVSVHPECLETVPSHEFTNLEAALDLATNEFPGNKTSVNENPLRFSRRRGADASRWREVNDKLEPRFIAEGFCGFYPPDGWLKLVEETDEVLKNNPNYRIVQVKQKFGELRFYAHGLTGYEQAFVTEMENKSLYICEICGSENDTVAARNDYWILTLCDECENSE